MNVYWSKYEGQWELDKQCGYGVEILFDGTKFEGNYLMGKKHGYVKLWEDGKFQTFEEIESLQ